MCSLEKADRCAALYFAGILASASRPKAQFKPLNQGDAEEIPHFEDKRHMTFVTNALRL
jgi:hypothetical protein